MEIKKIEMKAEEILQNISIYNNIRGFSNGDFKRTLEDKVNEYKKWIEKGMAKNFYIFDKWDIGNCRSWYQQQRGINKSLSEEIKIAMHQIKRDYKMRFVYQEVFKCLKGRIILNESDKDIERLLDTCEINYEVPESNVIYFEGYSCSHPEFVSNPKNFIWRIGLCDNDLATKECKISRLLYQIKELKGGEV